MKKAILLCVAATLATATIVPNASFAQTSQGHWELIKGDPFPDSVTQIVAGPGDLVYMATSDKGVFKSTDEGENWSEINTGLDGDLDITMLALGPNGDLLARDDRGNILYSKDAVSWTNDAIPWYWDYSGAILSSFTFDSHGAAYAGTIGAGIYKMDSIGTWHQIMPPNMIPGVQSMLFDNQNRLIVHYDKMYRVKSDFSAMDTSWSMTAVRNAPVQLLRATWGSILVVSDTLFELTQQLKPLTPAGEEEFVLDSSGNIYSFSFPGLVWSGLLKSSDHGGTWKWTSGTSADLPSENFVEATSYGFISDGEDQPEVKVAFDTTFAFVPIHELDNALKIKEIDVDSNQAIQAFDELKGIWSSTDHGVSWRRRMSRQNIQGTLLENGKYYSSRYDHLTTWPPMVSEDGGLHYKPVTVPSGLDGGFYASPTGSLWIEYGSAHFLRSLDNGTTWNEFAHFTDVPQAYYKSDSSESDGVVERGPYIWLATIAGIHLTSDNGVTWQFDTAHYLFNWLITGGKGSTIITQTSGDGIHWLSPGESADSGWLPVNAPFIEDQGGNILEFTYPNNWNDTEFFLRLSKNDNILGTLCVTPDSLDFSAPNYASTISMDSEGNIFAASYGDPRTGSRSPNEGLYRFVSSNASVTQYSPPDADALNVSVSNGTLMISSTSNLRTVELMDVTGRTVEAGTGGNSLRYFMSIAGIPSGAYFVKAETEAGITIRKVMVLH